jgi:lipopolysaccharide/colanic/teichoic acid biosynthesis glycosyltransferase
MRAKRALDVVGACTALAVLAVPMLVTALLIRLRLGAPVLYRATRPGLHGKPFVMFKFRTMRDARDVHGRPLPDAQRVTPLGRFLRKTSLDELPELFNVLRDEMSLVGPRPLNMEYLALYTPRQARRHEVKPGITGWAQIHGRNTLDWEERFARDVWYVENAGVWLDVRILARTVVGVLRRDGMSPDGDLDVPRFQGSARESGGADGGGPVASQSRR